MTTQNRFASFLNPNMLNISINISSITALTVVLAVAWIECENTPLKSQKNISSLLKNTKENIYFAGNFVVI